MPTHTHTLSPRSDMIMPFHQRLVLCWAVSSQQLWGYDLWRILIFLDAPWALGEHKYYHIFPHVANLNRAENCKNKQNQSLRKARARCVSTGHVGTQWKWWIQSRPELGIVGAGAFILFYFFICWQERSWFMLSFDYRCMSPSLKLLV